MGGADDVHAGNKIHNQLTDMIEIISKTFTKFGAILQTLQGWIITAGIFLAEYFFADHAIVVKAVLIAILLDAVWGISASIKQGKFALSELMRQTVAKIAIYGSALAALIQVDKVASTTLCTTVVSIPILVCEIWSMAGSMLIVKPDMPFLRLFRTVLKGEIANKLGVAPEEVEDILTGKTSKPQTDNLG